MTQPSRAKTKPQEKQPLKSREINALLEISKAIASGLYLEDVLRLIVTVTANVMDSKICSLWILDDKENRLNLKATQSISKEYMKERSLTMGEGVVGRVALYNRPMAILNVLEDPLYKEKDLARRESLVSMLSVPMFIRNRVIGVINCYTSYPHAFSRMEEEMLTTVANQAAVCIENSGLTETLNIDEIVRLVLEGVVKNIGFDRARLYMVNEKRNLLECKTAVGLDEEQIREVVLPFDPELSIVARAIIEKRPYVIPDAMQDPRVNPVMKSRFNLHTLVVIPLLARDKALGAIAVDHAEPGRTVTPEALEAMMAFAQEAGLAIQNASMYQELKAFSQQMEERVQKTTGELKKAEAQLIRSEKLAALGQLAAGVAHEIRNPLTSINILIHSIAESLPRDNTHREDLGVIEEEISRINLIVDQFLKFGKPAPPLLAETEVAPLFEETLQLFKAQIERQQITVVRDFPSLPKVVIDREQMKQVILNLLLNAVQAMPAGGRLGLTGRVAEDRREIEVAICNSGPGIPPEHMGKLFDPFFSTKEGGVGLGLPIAHRIVEQHQGKIEVESTPDVGTCFTVGLPIPARKAKDADHSDRR